MKNKKELKSFVASSAPPEVEPTAREMYLASHPEAARLQRAHMQELRTKLADLLEGLNPMLHQFINKAESARQIGIVLIELSDTLPGRKLTRDFYEQMRREFVDAQGRTIPFELLEWFVRCARSNQMPIEDMATALRWNQPLLLASGDEQFQLQQETVEKHRIPPMDEWGRLTTWLEKSDIEQTWSDLKKNPNYFSDGHLRPDLKAMYADEFRAKMAVMDEIRKELGL
jgi:hypothetical protein